MKTIQLTRGKCAVVDDEDYEKISKLKWHACKQGNMWYAESTTYKDRMPIIFRMHRFVLGLNHGDSRQIDHIDCDGLNNRKSNLRIATKQQNQANSRGSTNGSSKYKGVSWNEYHNKWRARIMMNRKETFIGYFSSQEDAAKAYDVAAIKYFGEYARTNFSADPKEMAELVEAVK